MVSTYDQEFIGTLLVENGLITQEQLEEALEERDRTGNVLGHILVEFGFTSADKILDVLAKHLGMRTITLKNKEIPSEVIKRIGPTTARAYGVVPVEVDNGSVTVALSDPLNISILDDLRFMLDAPVKGVVASKEDIEAALQRF